MVHWLALLTAGMLSALSLPRWRKACLRVGLVDAPGQRKIHHEPIPLAGGWAVLTGILFVWLTGWVLVRWGFASRELQQTMTSIGSPESRLLLGALGGMVGMLLVGWADDKWELTPAWKFSGQLLVALGMATAGARIPQFGWPFWLATAVSVLWILTVVNAFNFSDNMNGLCAGLAVLGGLCLGLGLAAKGNKASALLAFSAAGAALGFLPWNFPKAKAFLGDGGSHALGGLLAALSLGWCQLGSAAAPGCVAVPLLALGVPLLDLLWVVARRTYHKRPFYVGDTNHLSHMLVGHGLSRVQAVGTLWVLAAGLGGLALWMAGFASHP